MAWVPTPAYSWEGWYPVETGNFSSGDSLVEVITVRRHLEWVLFGRFLSDKASRGDSTRYSTDLKKTFQSLRKGIT